MAPRARLRTRRPRIILLAGDEVVVEVRESLRARRARIVVRPERAPEVIVPAGASDALVDGLLEQHAGWLRRQVTRSRALAGRASTIGLDRPGVVWLAGEAVPVARLAGASATARSAGGVLRVGGNDDEAAAAVGRWYRREARARIEAAVAREARRLGVRPGPLSVRDQRTRWGSCAHTGALSFNWRLVLAPAAVLEYVVVHELCHLRRHDHSRAFWRLVDDALPGWEAHARWLKEHAAALQGYEPARAIRPAAR